MAKKTISKSVLWQLFGKIAFQGIHFFTTPIFTRLLTQADYGYVTLYTSWLSIFTLVEGLSVASSSGVARIKYGEDKLSGFLSSIMSISVISFSVVLAVMLIFGNFFANLLGFSRLILTVLVIHSFFSFVISFEIGRLDVLKEAKKSALLALAQSIITVGLSLCFVFLLKDNKAEGRIYGQAISSIGIGLILFVLIYVRGKSFWNPEYNKFCVKLALPLIFHELGHIIFAQSDKIMLERICDTETVGIYGVTVTLCTVLGVIFGALNTAWVPFYYDFKKAGDTQNILHHSKRYIKFFTLTSVGFILLSFDVFKLIAPEEYYPGMNIIPLFVLSNYFSYLYLFPVNHEFFKEKTKLIPVITFFVALLNIAINYFLIPVLGMFGAALATLIAHILLFVFHEVTARFIVKDFEYPWHIYIPGIVVITVMIIAGYFLKDLFYIRWVITAFVAAYMLRDIIKNKSIF